MNEDFKGDFLGFTFNGIHSSDLGIVRTVNGLSEYKMLPTLKDNATDRPNNDGQYYFGSNYSKRDIPVNFAFDHMAESQFQALRRMANDKQLHRLQFDEFGDKFYVAKITGSATMKHLAFVEGGDRIYKGEGTLTFSCLYPYLQEEIIVTNQENFEIENNGVVTIFPKITLTNLQNIGRTITFSINDKEQGKFEVPEIKTAYENFVFIDSSTKTIQGMRIDGSLTKNGYNRYYTGDFLEFAPGTQNKISITKDEKPTSFVMRYTKSYLQ